LNTHSAKEFGFRSTRKINFDYKTNIAFIFQSCGHKDNYKGHNIINHGNGKKNIQDTNTTHLSKKKTQIILDSYLTLSPFPGTLDAQL
jgi:hypothetical protein